MELFGVIVPVWLIVVLVVVVLAVAVVIPMYKGYKKEMSKPVKKAAAKKKK